MIKMFDNKTYYFVKLIFTKVPNLNYYFRQGSR